MEHIPTPRDVHHPPPTATTVDVVVVAVVVVVVVVVAVAVDLVTEESHQAFGMGQAAR